jgi:hypothetical protein
MTRSAMARGCLVLIGILATLSPQAGAQDGAADLPASYTEKLAITRDLTQTDRAANLPDGGASCCGPVSISNSLFALAELGYPHLVPQEASVEQTHYELARILAGDAYTAAGSQRGTNASRMIRGANRYVTQQGYSALFEFQGWRTVPAEYRTGHRPEREWIWRNLFGPRAVWFNIGWYRYDEPTDTYHRNGGHWVTAVGYGIDQEGNPDPEIVIIHDPSPRSGFAPRADHVRFERLESGQLGSGAGVPRKLDSAKGLWRLTGGLEINRRRGDTALLDGVLVMTLQPPPAAADLVTGD